MKKGILTGVVLMASIFMVSCGTANKMVKNDTPSGMAKEFANAPAWVLNPAGEKGICAIGSAKVGPAGMQFARTEAMANGRDELARIISVRVKNMVKNFTQVTGVGDAQTVDKVSSQVSKQVTSEVLSGSRQKDLWISPSGEIYMLVVIDPEIAKETVKEAVETSYQNDKALWQQFQAKNGHQELDKEVEKEFSQVKAQE